MKENSQGFSENIIKLPIEQFLKIYEAGLTLDHIYLLQYFERSVEYPQELRTVKIEPLIQTLIRKGLLTHEHKITKAGELVLQSFKYSNFVMKPEKAKSVIDNSASISFDSWWKVYPSTDIFEHKGRKFNGNRGLKTKKDECKAAFVKIINEGEFTASDLIRALEYEVLMKKEASLREGENKLKYMVNTRSYLSQRLFENFVTISKEKPTAEKGSPSIDI